jgi:hypothetical protein
MSPSYSKRVRVPIHWNSHQISSPWILIEEEKTWYRHSDGGYFACPETLLSRDSSKRNLHSDPPRHCNPICHPENSGTPAIRIPVRCSVSLFSGVSINGSTPPCHWVFRRISRQEMYWNRQAVVSPGDTLRSQPSLSGYAGLLKLFRS